MISLILAAGKGTRMKSDLPKVIHKVNGVPMVMKVVDILERAGINKNILILGHKKEIIIEQMGQIEYVEQKEQLGTGHAIKIAKDEILKYKQDVIIINGDAPLIKEETIVNMIKIFNEKQLSSIILSCDVEKPFGYGRIVSNNNQVLEIVEEKEASDEIKKITEVNAGVYIFKHEKLLDVLDKIDNNNEKGEYYLTDAVKLLVEKNERVESYKINDEKEMLGVNSKAQLAEVSTILRDRKNNDLMDKGVIIVDPNNTYIEDSVEIGVDTVVYPNVIIQGKTKIGDNCIIMQNTRIIDSVIKDNVTIEASVIEESTVENEVTIGPFAHLRPLANIKEKAHIGNFVEIKKSTLEQGVKVGHLTYIGDSEIGENTNVGAGTITCNYDGKNKHKTIIGKDSFIGSNSIIVAPVNIGDNTYTAAGSVITKDVPDRAIAFGRSKQKNKEEWNK